MKAPILIIGYERSGTTMLRRLVSMHPQFSTDLLHEKGNLLLDAKTVEDVIQRCTLKNASISAGQKLPYVSFKRARKYVEKFRGFFPASWIIHIIRDPIYAINSQVNTFKKEPKRGIHDYFQSVPQVYQWLEKVDRVRTVRYETLISDPFAQLRELYDWISPGVSDEHISKAISTKGAWQSVSGRTMVGLRRHEKIGDTHPKMALGHKHIKLIKKMKNGHKDLFGEEP